MPSGAATPDPAALGPLSRAAPAAATREDHGLGTRLASLAELGDEDRAAMLNGLDALVTKARLRVLTNDGR